MATVENSTLILDTRCVTSDMPRTALWHFRPIREDRFYDPTKQPSGGGGGGSGGGDYTGLTTETAEALVNNDRRTIAVNVRIDNLHKQDTIEFIEIDPAVPVTQEDIDKLTTNAVNRISYDGKIFNLGYRDSGVYKYFAPDSTGEQLETITLDLQTGEITITIPTLLEDHINNTEVHIQPGERDYWNEKADAEVVGEVLKIY